MNVAPSEFIATVRRTWCRGAGVAFAEKRQRGSTRAIPIQRFPPSFKTAERVSHVLGPSDLRDIVKLCQVLAFTIADDGCLPADLRQQLFDLADDLDSITEQWSNFNGWQDRA